MGDSLVYSYQVGKFGEDLFEKTHKKDNPTLTKLPYHDKYDFKDTWHYYQIKTWPKTVFSKLNEEDKLKLVEGLKKSTRYVVHYQRDSQIKGLKEYLLAYGLLADNIFLIKEKHLNRLVQQSLASLYKTIMSISYSYCNKFNLNTIEALNKVTSAVEKTIISFVISHWEDESNVFEFWKECGHLAFQDENGEWSFLEGILSGKRS